MMRQNKLFTSIYVAGTGLSIALVMVLFIIFYVKFAPIYPEYNRNRILTMSTTMRVGKNNEGNWSCNSGVAYNFITNYLQKMKHVEAVAMVENYPNTMRASRVGNSEAVKVNLRHTNADFWRVFTFDFVAGHGFSDEEVQAVQSVAVLSESMARQLFATSAPLGEKIYLNAKEFTVIGVVKDASNATPYASGDVWIPVTHSGSIMGLGDQMGLMGVLRAYMLTSDKKALRTEVLDVINRYDSQDSLYRHEFFGQPDDYWMGTFRSGKVDEYGFSAWSLMKNYFYIVLALLFIPALNLSGMISNRMDGRLSELGIRRAYGANNRELISQVLWENFLLTVLGGFLGLLLSFVVVWTASDWVIHLFDGGSISVGKEVDITVEMLFNPLVFISAMLFCIVLNFVSALIPTVWALRHSIINSIHSKR